MGIRLSFDRTHNINALLGELKTYGLKGLYVALINFFLMSIGWYWWGKSIKRTQHIRGAKLTTPRLLRRKLRWQLKASKFRLAGVPLVKNSETEHILLTGSTGVGKTTAMNQLLSQIRAKGQKAVVVDTSGNYIENFYREGKDIILNPFDDRCSPWHFWAECLEEPHYEELVASLITDTSKSDPFWARASRVVVAELLREMKKNGNTSNKELANHLFFDKVSELETFLQKTCAARFTTKDADKMSYGVLANFIAPLQGIKYIPDADNPFSIRQWVKEDKVDSWLFLAMKTDHRNLMTTFLSMWLEVAVSALIGLGEDRTRRRRLWFIIDELASLRRLPALPDVMQEGRKFGACVVAGFQSISSLRKYYGNDAAVELINSFNTKLFFRNDEPDTCAYISKMLGESEIIETREQISYGAHEMRDGTTLNSMRRISPIVIPTEILKLDKFWAYLKLPGNYPITKIRFKFKKMTKLAERIHMKKEAIIINSIDYLKETQMDVDQKSTNIDQTDMKENNVDSSQNINDSNMYQALPLDDDDKQIDSAAKEQRYIEGYFFKKNDLLIKLNSGETIQIPLLNYSVLLKASRAERNDVQLIDNKQMLHWPNIGLMIHVDGLI